MAITKNVVITKIELGAQRTVVHYTGDDGSTWKIGNLASKLEEATKTEINSADQELKEGGTPNRSITVEKDGKFWNLINVGKPQAKAAPSAGGYKKSSYVAPSAEDKRKTDVKIQVMNSLTNSIASLGSGKTVAEYEQRVKEFVLLGNSVIDQVLSGDLVAAPAVVEEVEDEEVTESLGF